MKLTTIMKKIQEADIVLTGIVPEESFNFYIDLSQATEKHGKYAAKYYDRCEIEGYSIEEAHEQLGEYLRSNLTILVDEQ